MTRRSRALLPLWFLASAACKSSSDDAPSAPAAQATSPTAWLLVDQDADPHGRGGHPGCVFLVDPATAALSLFCSDERLVDPCDVLPWDDAHVLLDYHGEGGLGRLYRLSADGTQLDELSLTHVDGHHLVDPYSMQWAPDGSLWIVDKNADPERRGPTTPPGTGTLWRADLTLGTLEILATGRPLAAPTAVCFTGMQGWLIDADAFQERPLADPEGGLFRVAPRRAPLETACIPTLLVSPLDMVVDHDGTFLMIDVNADPELRGRLRGGVYRLDPSTGDEALVCHAPEFRDPLRGARDGRTLYVVDANADPAGFGPDGLGHGYAGDGRGAIFRVDLETGKATTWLASEQTVNPVRLRILP